MLRQPDYYRTLEITPSADDTEIKRAYRILAKLYHPDRVPANRREWARAKMACINTAYEVLSDPQRRAQYDRQQEYAQVSDWRVSSMQGRTIWRTRRVRERSRRQKIAQWRVVVVFSAVVLGAGVLVIVLGGRWLGLNTPVVRCAWIIVLTVSLCMILAALKLTEL